MDLFPNKYMKTENEMKFIFMHYGHILIGDGPYLHYVSTSMNSKLLELEILSLLKRNSESKGRDTVSKISISNEITD